MGKGSDALSSHVALQSRRNLSRAKLVELQNGLDRFDSLRDAGVSVYCAGSMARLEMGQRSDVDFFLLSEGSERISRLLEIEIFASLVTLNRDLGYPAFSNDGELLRIYPIGELVAKTGRPIDDSENFFTARMLLILESVCVSNGSLYRSAIERVVGNYLRDRRGKRGFKPLFLLNDLLRYWRTLCLNYEQKRSDGSQKWRTKNLNLKFSRMLTVYSTVLLILLKGENDEGGVASLFGSPPLDRVAVAFDILESAGFEWDFRQVLDDYELFLSIKEMDQPEIDDLLRQGGGLRRRADEAANRFSRFFYSALMHHSVPEDARRFVMV